METSEIVIRPFQTYKEPCAIIKFGNVTIELEYTAFLNLTMDTQALCNCRLNSVTCAALNEVTKEMEFEISGDLPSLHRDSDSPWVKSITSNPLHHTNGEIIKHKDKTETISKCPYGTG